MRIRKHLSAVHLPAVANPVFRSQITATKAAAAAAAAAAVTAAPPPGCQEEERSRQGGQVGKAEPGELKVVVSGAAAVGKGRGFVVQDQVCSSSKVCPGGGMLQQQQDEVKNIAMLQSSSNLLQQQQHQQQQQQEFSSPKTPVALPTRPKRTKPRSCSNTNSLPPAPPARFSPPPPLPNPATASASASTAAAAENKPDLHLHLHEACMQHQLVQDHGHGELDEADDDEDDDSRSPKSAKGRVLAAAKDLIQLQSPRREIPSLQQQQQQQQQQQSSVAAMDTDTVVVSGAIVEQQRRSTRRPRSRSSSLRNLRELDDDEVDEDEDDDDDDDDGDGEPTRGSQCRRMDGKGWRCHRMTQPDYSLCDYHLDKFRETNQRKLKNASSAAHEPTRRRSRVKRKPVKARSLMSI